METRAPFPNHDFSGCGLCIVVETTTGLLLGSAVPGRRTLTAEETAAAAVTELEAALLSGACVDDWMQDQLIVFMGLADGESRMVSYCVGFDLYFIMMG